MQDPAQERIKAEESAKPQPGATIGGDASSDPVVLNPNIDIPKYDGTEDPRPWIESLEEIGVLYHWADYIIARYAAMNMTGSAKTWLNLHKASFTSWENIKIRLIQDFSLDANKEELRMKLNRMQHWNEPAIRFAEDILVLCNKVDPAMEEETKIDHVIGGLKKEYSFALYLNPPKTTDELLVVCKKMDSFEKKYRERVEKSRNLYNGPRYSRPQQQSRDELGHTGSGCLIKTTNSIEKMNRRNPDFCSVFRSELIAIYEALKSIRNTNYQDIWILTDISRNIIGYLQKLSKTSKIHLQWIPSHVGIEGNEAADVLAKKGTKEPLPQKNKLTFKEIETVVKTKINKNWRIPPMHSWYSGVNPGGALNIRNRQHQTTLTRFRTAHLKPLKIENNNKIYPTCPKCSLAPPAPDHILACIRCTKQDLWERPLLIIKQLEEHELMEFVPQAPVSNNYKNDFPPTPRQYRNNLTQPFTPRRPYNPNFVPKPNLQRNTYNKSQEVSKNRTEDGRPICFKCNKPGHVARYCRVKFIRILEEDPTATQEKIEEKCQMNEISDKPGPRLYADTHTVWGGTFHKRDIHGANL
ncbi:hypothetical protein LAZ67_X002386 [Cordylochernes scorpioides]|uniref:CCHC-type domain-containing protein n=1 Tax=Cordylochernes scorpioides TaxID=51811 RepID=A0ABY6LWJ7_9ARAC|nr:hypothetical protein LAZ67_X002386 [Cordylochernes scorpioides]